LKSASPQPLPQEGGAKILYVFYLPPSLLGEGGQGDEVDGQEKGVGGEKGQVMK